MVFTTFTFGIALPLLFPICAFAMTNLYISEKIQFAYLYRKPPNYGGSLSVSAIDLLSWCPIISMLFGYWMMGNRQIFFNETKALETFRDEKDPYHLILGYNTTGEFKPDQTMIFLIFLPFFIFFD